MLLDLHSQFCDPRIGTGRNSPGWKQQQKCVHAAPSVLASTDKAGKRNEKRFREGRVIQNAFIAA